MAEGRTNGSIAQTLVVSEAAVRKHVGNVFAKLALPEGTDRRVSAVLAYLRRVWADPLLSDICVTPSR